MCRKNPHTILEIVFLLLMNLIKIRNVGAVFEIINRWIDAFSACLAFDGKKGFTVFQNDEIHFAFVRIPQEAQFRSKVDLV